jgi:hypothetical protein
LAGVGKGPVLYLERSFSVELNLETASIGVIFIDVNLDPLPI